jgi:hypothetical protein
MKKNKSAWISVHQRLTDDSLGTALQFLIIEAA